MQWYCFYEIQFAMHKYIGCTNNINMRIREHKARCGMVEKKCRLYECIRDNGGWKDEFFSILDMQFCDLETARITEQELIDSNNCDLNMNAVGFPKELLKVFPPDKCLDIIYMNFTDEIKTAKPKISDGSLKTYNSLLRSIHKAVFNGDDADIKNFSKEKPIMAFLDKKPYSTRKTYLAALICVAPGVATYKEVMMGDIKSYNDETKKSELTDKLENSAISQEEIDQIVADLKQNAKGLYKKKQLRVPDLMELQNYVLLSLYYGHIVPRRATDYVAMLYQNYNKEKDNYIDFDNDKLVFNQYKTAQKMGETLKGRQELQMPSSLKKILKKWIEVIPREVDNLFFNSNLEPLSNVSLNQRLNAIFQKKASVNALRHFYLTSRYKTLMEETQKMGDDMNDMGSSIAQANNYIKINDKDKG